MDDISMRIDIISGSNIWLRLRGTVMVVGCRHDDGSWQQLLPVELVSIYETRKSDVRRTVFLLLAALAVGLLFLAANGVLLPSVGHFAGSLIAVILMIGAIVAAPGLILLNIFMKTRVIRIDVLPTGQRIEFWARRKHVRRVDEFLASLQRQARANEFPDMAMTAGVAPVAGEFKTRPWLRYVAIALLCGVPAVMLEQIRLFWLAVAVPGAVLVYDKIRYFSLPKGYRHAMNAYMKGDLEAASRHLTSLLSSMPEYTPSRSLLAITHMRMDNYDKAFTIARGLIWDDSDKGRELEAYLALRLKLCNRMKMPV